MKVLHLNLGFNPEKAGNTSMVMQYSFKGQVKGDCYFSIGNSEMDFNMGSAESPDLTIETPFELWMDIITGKTDGQQAFMDQKYKVEGDVTLLMKMNELFGR